jgi:transposase
MTGELFQYRPLPAETAYAAKAIFNLGNVYLIIGDQLDQLLAEFDLAELDPTSKYSISMVCLDALATIFQFAEGLPDRVAADATRTRMDWKYALHLPINYPGLKPEALCRFRQQLWFDTGGQVIFEQITNRILSIGLLSKREQSNLEAQMVLLTVCAYTRLDRLIQAFNQALESLAACQSEYLRAIALPHWYVRYDCLNLDELIPHSDGEQAALAQALGSDAQHLLKACRSFDAQAESKLPEIHNLHLVFNEQFDTVDEGVGKGSGFRWRPDRCATCSSERGESL